MYSIFSKLDYYCAIFHKLFGFVNVKYYSKFTATRSIFCMRNVYLVNSTQMDILIYLAL